MEENMFISNNNRLFFTKSYPKFNMGNFFNFFENLLTFQFLCVTIYIYIINKEENTYARRTAEKIGRKKS